MRTENPWAIMIFGIYGFTKIIQCLEHLVYFSLYHNTAVLCTDGHFMIRIQSNLPCLCDNSCQSSVFFESSFFVLDEDVSFSPVGLAQSKDSCSNEMVVQSVWVTR